jgi:hexosaminidase
MNINLIPQPQYVQTRSDKRITGMAEWGVALRMPASDSRLAVAAQSIFREVTESSPSDSAVYALTTQGQSVNVQMAERVRGRHDGYVLIIDENRIEIYALTASGLFYGMATLKQLLGAEDGAAPASTIIDWADLQLRSDYLDLRTVYPTFENILKYVAELSSYKINTLVIEYEDKLPFQKLPFLRHPEFALTDEQHQLLLLTAHSHFVQVIPKQQSFGHLEYILKHPAYIGFRETPDSIGELCPHRPGSYEMMAEILEDIAKLHPHSQYLHMGCDEVWSLGTCEDCLRSGLSPEASFIRFVNQLAEKACLLNKTPMIWHDMIMNATELEISQLDKRVVVVVWIYGGHQMKADARLIIRKLRNAGIAVLGGSSVRCWDDNGDQNYPLIHNRIKNITDWVQLSQSEQLDGIINTNWSAPFAFGSPYGLFETSRYPAFFAADLNWNQRADANTFLTRFLSQFHGMDTQLIPAETMNDYHVTDYYQLIPQLLPEIRLNRPTAELIDAMIQYELPAQRRLPLQTFLFRGELSADNAVVMTSLSEKYATGQASLKVAKAAMQAILAQLLTPQMAELFVMSRFYRLELYEAKFHEVVARTNAENKKAGNSDA